jgi:2-methylcitrate dehydratase PrpD
VCHSRLSLRNVRQRQPATAAATQMKRARACSLRNVHCRHALAAHPKEAAAAAVAAVGENDEDAVVAAYAAARGEGADGRLSGDAGMRRRWVCARAGLRTAAAGGRR